MTHPVLRTDEAPYQCSRAQCQYINFAVVILREVFDIYAVLFRFLFFLSPFFGGFTLLLSFVVGGFD